MLAAGGFACVSMNDLIPGATDRRCFHDPCFDLETSHYLLGYYQLDVPGVALVHPVYGLPEYLQKAWQKSLHNGDINEFISTLQRIALLNPAAGSLLAEYGRTAGLALAGG